MEYLKINDNYIWGEFSAKEVEINGLIANLILSFLNFQSKKLPTTSYIIDS